VIIPAYNERKSVADVINAVPSKISGIREKFIVVIDDGSTDNTRTILPKSIYLIKHIKNRGLGRSFDEGLKLALELNADIIVNIDADGQFNPRQIEKLIKPILDGQADIVLGSRFIKISSYKTNFIKKYGNKLLARLVSISTGQRLYDVTCGFRAYSKEAALNLNIYDKFSYTLESLIDLSHKDFKIQEVAVEIKERRYGKSKITESIIHYIVKSIAILIRNLRDQRPFYFFVLPGIITLILSLAGFIFLLIRFIKFNVVSPYRAVLTFSISFFAISIFLFSFGLLFDHLNKIKKNEEDVLYYLKRNGKK